MNDQELTGQRALAIFLIAGVAFSPVFVTIFSGSNTLFGIPPLFLYLFAVWGLVVLAIAVNVFRTGSEERDLHDQGFQSPLALSDPSFQGNGSGEDGALSVEDLIKPTVALPPSGSSTGRPRRDK